MDFKTIAELISKSKKTTPATVYIQGAFDRKAFKRAGFKVFGEGKLWILIGDFEAIEKWIAQNRENITDLHKDISARYSALPLKDLSTVEARVEPGAIIREGASIGKDCVIMMGAVVNVGAEVGQGTMVDMNAVIGARAIIGKECHIGAGAVIAGVLEPPSRKPVVIADHVIVGGNAVVLEGVAVGKGSVVAAGAVVVDEVKPGMVVAGVPAKVIHNVADIADKDKISIVKSLRRLK
jgi:2,3,4,5-tetrahydropyridine-2-carboxylate N-succinyltransferase/tetrahydrodipicolinate N-acetyltransferase